MPKARLVEKLPIAIASMGLGRAAQHDLETKIRACSEAGFNGIELFYEDIKLPARAMTTGTFEDNLLKSAAHFKALCDKYELEVMVLQPFKNYDGLLSEKRHKEKIAKLHNWFRIAKVLKTDIIQIPSMFHQGPKVATGDLAKIADDLREVADLGAKEDPPIRFAYETMAWGGHVDVWQTAWKITQLVDRPNFGMCMDTYQTLSQVYGDCTSESGLRENAEQRLEADLEEFVNTVPLEKVWYVQLADAPKMSPPIGPSHEWWNPNMKPNMIWSRNARLFPLEGGYLPVLKMFETWLFKWGYRGWVSMELFNRSMSDPDPTVPETHAWRGIESWKKCVEVLELDKRIT